MKPTKKPRALPLNRGSKPAITTKTTTASRASGAGSGKRSEPRSEPVFVPAAKPPAAHFEYSDGGARKVCISGTFNDWHPEGIAMVSLGNGRWAKDLPLPPGTYEYRLIVDGKWAADPAAKQTVANPFGDFNSVVTIPVSAQ